MLFGMSKDTSRLARLSINVRRTLFFRAGMRSLACATLLLSGCATPLASEPGKVAMATPSAVGKTAPVGVVRTASTSVGKVEPAARPASGRDLARLTKPVAPASVKLASAVTQAPVANPAVADAPAVGLADISMHPVADKGGKALAAASPAAPAPTPLRAPLFEPAVASAQPNLFGTVAMPVGRTPEDAKWIRARAQVLGADGPWAGTLRQARAAGDLRRLAIVNAWVNHRIAYATPESQYGLVDYWATGRESLTSGRGNCTAYAIAKIELLRAAGVPAQDIYLVLVKDLVRRADHAVVAVRIDGRFVILDSGSDAVLSPDAVHDYRPILTYGYGHTWIHGYRAAPTLTLASTSGADGAMVR
jgi:predicted transglutaminase-like cysteine proteinase